MITARRRIGPGGRERAGGIDLARALWDGFITRRDVDETQRQCRCCGAAALCGGDRVWTERILPAGGRPATCRNAPLLEELSRI